MRWIVAIEVAFVLLLLAGVALVHVPAALILGGLLGIVATERAFTQQRIQRRTDEQARLRRVA